MKYPYHTSSNTLRSYTLVDCFYSVTGMFMVQIYANGIIRYLPTFKAPPTALKYQNNTIKVSRDESGSGLFEAYEHEGKMYYQLIILDSHLEWLSSGSLPRAMSVQIDLATDCLDYLDNKFEDALGSRAWLEIYE